MPNQLDVATTDNKKSFWIKSHLPEEKFKEFFNYSKCNGFWNEVWFVDILHDGSDMTVLKIRMKE